MDRDTKHEEPGSTGHTSAVRLGSARGNPPTGEAHPTVRPEPGMRVRILTPVDDDDGIAARVIRVEDDRVLLRVLRGVDPQRRIFISGGQVQLLLGGRDAAHLFHATVLSRPEDGIISVVLCGHPLRLQRREYFRLAVRLPIAVRLDREAEVAESEAEEREFDEGDEFDEGNEPISSGPTLGRDGVSDQETGNSDVVTSAEPVPVVPEFRIFRLADLSGGGCLCLDPDDLLRRGQLYSARLDLYDGEPPLQVRVEVVRRGITLGYPSAGLRFVAFAEKHRERIMRTLFCEYRRRVVTGRV